MATSSRPRREPADQQQRNAAIDPRRSFIVQAPAGSGKTELLIQRYLTLLATVAEPERIFAITFTKKAAGEMRARVMKALRDAEESTPVTKPHQAETRALAAAVLQQDSVRNWNLLATPSRLRIVTIDSLSNSIVQQVPFTSRLGALGGITEDARNLHLQAAHATVRLLETPGETADALRRALMHLENNVPELEKLLADMLQRRDQWSRHLHHGDVDALRAELEATLARIVCTYLSELEQMIPSHVKDELAEIARHAGTNLHEIKPSHRISVLRNMPGFPGCTKDDLDYWCGLASLLVTDKGGWRVSISATIGLPAKGSELPRKRLKDDILPDLKEISGLEGKLAGVAALPPCAYEESQWQMLRAIFQLLPRALEQLRIVFAAEQTVDFTEVSLAALEGLASQSVESALGHPIEHLLADEFQDTSVSQVQLLRALTRGWPTDGSRTLFLVGDPMQSIYRFRQAEVALFLRAQSGKLDLLPLEPLRLTENFRSQARIVDWVNESFEGIFPQSDDVATGAVHFEPSTAFHEPTERPAVVVHPYFETSSRLREARDVVRVIEEARARVAEEAHSTDEPAKPRRIAVLVRAREHLRHIVAELHQRNVPFRAVQIDSLADRSVVLDIVSLTRALLHPADRIAWLAVLRAPWCGLTLDSLFKLCNSHPHASVWESMQDGSMLPAPERLRLQRTRDVLQQALQRLGRVPLRQFVESTWIALGGPACIPVSELGTAKQLFELLEKLESEGDLDFEELDEALGKLYAAPDALAADEVQLMTIHKAKGLEFDVVILPGLGRKTRSDESRLMLWEERPGMNEADLFLAPIKARAAEKDDLYTYLSGNEKRRSEEESKRVLYVAATRARSELHLFGHLRKPASELLADASKPEKTSLLALLWDIVENEFMEAAKKQATGANVSEISAASDVAEFDVDSLPPLRRLADGWQSPAAPSAVLWQPAPENKTATAADITFEWVGERTRTIGTVVHAFLQRIATEGLANWDENKLAHHRDSIRAALANRGLAADVLDEDADRALAALRFTLRDQRGRWILSPHPEARSEYALSAVEADAVYHVQIDRTFIDEQGTRWIVDFKTSPLRGDADQFADAQVEKYREQLVRYARVLQKREARPVRAGLYFPLLEKWRECEIQSD